MLASFGQTLIDRRLNLREVWAKARRMLEEGR